MSGREVDVGGGDGPIFKYIRSKLESEFLTVKMSSFQHAKV